MLKFDKTITYALEMISDRDSAKAILDDRANGKDEGEMTEYIGGAVINIEKKIAIAEAKVKNYQAAIKDEKARLEYLQEQVAEWMEECGADKMQSGLGEDEVSSVTIYTPAPTQVVKVDDEAKIDKKFFVTKTTLDKTAVKQALQNGEEVKGATLEVTHVANKIKINKKMG